MQRARRLEASLGVQTAQTLEKIINEYIKRLRVQLGELPPGASRRRVEQTLEAFILTRNRIAVEMANAVVLGKRTARIQTMGIWEEALELIAPQLGARTAPLTMIGAYANIGGGRNWRTLLNRDYQQYADVVDRVFLEGFVGGRGPDEIERRIRRWVQGADELEDLFEGDRIDLRRLTKEQRRRARQMLNNSRRIAFSEVHNARAEAEVQHFMTDPLIRAVRWRLSPDRGTGGPDECDVLATADLYGLGPGVYPLNAVPTTPHPYDRCEREPVTRSTKRAGEPKPDPSPLSRPRFDSSVRRRFSTRDGWRAARNRAVGTARTGRQLTEEAIARSRGATA